MTDEPRMPPAVRRRAPAAMRVGLVVGLAAIAAGALAPVVVRGRTFGALVERALPPMRGRLHVGGGRWTWSGAWALARGRAAPLALEDVRLDDPDGTEVLRVRRLSGAVTLDRAGRRAVIRDLVVDGVSWRFEDLGAGRGIGFLAALRPRAARAAAAPSEAAAPFGLAVEDARLGHVDARFGFPSWGLALAGVDATASLEYAPERGDGAFTFDVHGADVGGGGELRIGPERAAWRLAFSRGRLERVATTRAAPNVIHLEASDVAASGSTLAGTADFGGVYVSPRPPARAELSVSVRATDAAGALAAVARGRGAPRALGIAGAGAEAALEISGPYDDPRVAARARGLSLADGALALDAIAFSLEAAPLAGRYRLRDVAIDWRGVGRVEGAIGVDVVGGGLALRDLSLTLARPTDAGGGGPRALGIGTGERARRALARRTEAAVGVAALSFSGGVLHARDLTLPLLGGRLAAAGDLVLRDGAGRWITPSVDATLDARRLDLARVLGARFVSGDVSFRARVRGRVSDLTCDLTFGAGERLVVLGEPFAPPPALSFVFTEGRARVHLPLAGRDGARIVLDGTADTGARLDLRAEITRFPFDRLPGVGETSLRFGGPISGRLRLAGPASDLALEGALGIDPVWFEGRAAGRASLAVSTDASGGLRARGALMTGVEVDGVLRATPRGPAGEMTLRLDRLVTTGLGLALPGRLALRAVVSGEVVARVAPGTASVVEGRLTALDLALAAPGARARPWTVATEGPAAVSARAGGALSFGPARFRGAAGDFVLAVVSESPAFTGSLRGRVELAPLAPLLAPLASNVEGALDVDARATRAGGAGPPSLEATATIATPVALRLAAIPASLRVPSGALRFARGALEARGLPLSFEAELPRQSPVSRAAGSLRVDGRLAFAGLAFARRAPRVRGRVELGHLELEIPRLGPSPVVVDGGGFEVEGALSDLAGLALTNVDVPLRGAAKNVALPVGTLDRATFDLRLRGDAGPATTLSGDVEVLAARVKPDKLGGASAGGPRAAGASPGGDGDGASLRNPRLDVHIRSRGGAVDVELAHAPDVHLDVDLHATGTIAHPKVTGRTDAKGLWSSFVMGLKRLFD